MKGLGEEMGFPGKQADSRIAQYESGNKMPRKDVILELTKILDINPTYLVEPDPEYIMGVLQFLFEMDSIYDIDLDVDDENIVIKIPKNKEKNYDLALFFLEWIIVLKQKQAGDISQEVYDEWKMQYPYNEDDELEQTKKSKLQLLEMANNRSRERTRDLDPFTEAMSRLLDKLVEK